MTRDELRLNHGGLMRCCVHWAHEWMRADPSAEVPDGTQITCESEGRVTMVVDNGWIRWIEVLGGKEIKR